jgi:hypothetical protein
METSPLIVLKSLFRCGFTAFSRHFHGKFMTKEMSLSFEHGIGRVFTTQKGVACSDNKNAFPLGCTT